MEEGKTHLLVYLGEMCVQDGVDYLIRAVGRCAIEVGPSMTYTACSWGVALISKQCVSTPRSRA
jgi:hypothetical protein